MGNRAQVKINKVYLYTHWGANSLENTVKKALAKKWRWDDPDYLTRIIFCEMIKGKENEETGYGIGTEKQDDIEKLIIIDCNKKEITIKDIYNKKEKIQFFKNFIN